MQVVSIAYKLGQDAAGDLSLDTDQQKNHSLMSGSSWMFPERLGERGDAPLVLHTVSDSWRSQCNS